MSFTLPDPDPPPCAPAAFCAALAELVAIGMSVARMVGCAAEAEAALARLAPAVLADDGVPPMATCLAEAIEADRAAAAAAEARRDVVARADVVAAAFVRVSRAVRRTVLLAERLDRGWARGSDDRTAMARRQIARGVADAVARDAVARDAAGRDPEAAAERGDALDTVEEIGDGPAEEIIGGICRDLGVDAARMGPGAVDAGSALAAPGSVVASLTQAGLVPGGGGWRPAGWREG